MGLAILSWGKRREAGFYRRQYELESERTQAEAALQESEANLRSVFNAVDEALVLLEMHGRVLAINASGAARFGKTPEEMVGQNIWALFPHEVAARRRERIVDVVASGQPFMFEDQRGARWFHNSLYPVAGMVGSRGVVVVFSQDITERKQAEEALQNAW